MPLYEYRCAICGAVTEALQRAPAAPPCPRCPSRDTVRQVSRFVVGSNRTPRYTEQFREQNLPFLKSRPGAAQLMSDLGGSEEAAAYAITEHIGTRVDAALDNLPC